MYVEPFQVVEAANQLRELVALLQQEENRIYRAMCHTLCAHLQAVQRCIMAVAEVDVLAAKARLGVRLGGVIPEVRPVLTCAACTGSLISSSYMLIERLLLLLFDFTVIYVMYVITAGGRGRSGTLQRSAPSHPAATRSRCY